jgi:type I restriction enzyme S subunit
VLSPQTTYYRPSPSAFTPEFLRFQLLGPFYQRQLDEVKSQTTRDFVPISEQYRLFLLRPSLTEQREIATRLRTAFAWIDRLASEATSARKLIEHLDQTILAKAFRGELVSQDPNDEPASELLKRIRAERQAAGPPRRRNGQQKVRGIGAAAQTISK